MEHFIESVRKYPCLWNTTAIEYRDQELKDAAWAEVMKETDLASVKEVKLKWKKLRDSYRDALKRQSDMLAKEPAAGAKKTYPWKYMGLMQFLQPHMSARKRVDASACEEAGAGAGAGAGAAASNGHARAAPPPPASRSSDSSDSESAPEPPAKRRALALIERKLDYLCRRAPPPALAVADAAAAAAPAPLDPLDIFFNSMCQATKRFPYQTQIKIKRAVFEAVTGAEEALLAEQHSYAALWARAASSSSSERSPPAHSAHNAHADPADHKPV